MTIFAVLDPDQMMYRFAGAKPEVMLSEIEDYYPDIQTHKLTVNYRSTHAIIETCSKLIANNYSDNGGPYSQKYLKDVQPRENAPDGEPVTWTWYADAQEEAGALTSELTRMIEANEHKPGDVFVGARTRAQLGYLEGPLTRAKLPFINITGGSFWTSKHVADVVAYVALAFNEGDPPAFQRVYNIGSNWCTYPWGNKEGDYCTHRFLGRAFLEACTDYSTGKPSFKQVWKAAGSQRKFQPGVYDLTDLVRSLQATMARADNAGDVVSAVIDECYAKWLKHEEGITDGQGDSKLDDFATVIEIAADFDKVGDFLNYVNEAVKAADAVKDKAWDGYIVLSTVHRLKGLERPVVFGVGFSENRQQGLLPHTFSMQPPPNFGVLPTGGKGRIEDERCIAFVLVSRAKDEVHLSGVENYRKYSFMPSRFVSEMGLTTESISTLSEGGGM